MQPGFPLHASMQETCSAAVWVSHDATWRTERGCSSWAGSLTNGQAKVKVASVSNTEACFSPSMFASGGVWLRVHVDKIWRFNGHSFDWMIASECRLDHVRVRLTWKSEHVGVGTLTRLLSTIVQPRSSGCTEAIANLDKLTPRLCTENPQCRHRESTSLMCMDFTIGVPGKEGDISGPPG